MLTVLNNALERVNHFLTFKKPVHTNVLGLARSILALGTLLTLLFNSTDILFPDGLSGNQIIAWPATLSIFYLLEPNLEIARTASIVILLLVVIGWRPRLTCIFHWWVSFSLNSTALILDGGDQVAAIFSLLLIPVCLTDRRKWHWDVAPAPTNDAINFLNYSTLLVIKLQVSFIYLDAVVEKFRVEEWMNGTAIYYWLLSPYMGVNDTLRPLVFYLVTNEFFAPLLTWGTLILELMLFCGLAMTQKQKSKLFVAGVVFHFLIAISHGLFSFMCSMITALILYLKPLEIQMQFMLMWNKFSLHKGLFPRLRRVFTNS